MKIIKLLFAISFLIPFYVYSNNIKNAPGMYLDFPFLDVPFNTDHGNPLINPTMEQSLALNKDSANLINFGVGSIFPQQNGIPVWYGRIAVALVDLAFTVPTTWMHEEWHRAVMTNRNISSHDAAFDHVYDGSTTIPVNRVSDQDLINLKQQHPAEMVRLSAAGMESQVTYITELAKDKFFRNVRAWNAMTMVLQAIGVSGYMDACLTKKHPMTQEELNDVSARDFTGLDCNGWAYDLFTPDQPYSARGTASSGIGINRYVDFDQLPDSAQRYLVRNKNLSYLNFIEPQILGLNGLDIGENSFYFSMKHYLTSFGDSIDSNFFYKNKSINLFSTVHTYENSARNFLGLTLQVIDLQAFSSPIYLTPTLIVWQQPANQRFDDTTGAGGILYGLKTAFALNSHLQSYIELTNKTKGWVAGNVNIEAGYDAVFGMSATLF